MKEEGIGDRLLKAVKEARRERRLERIAELENRAKQYYCNTVSWASVLDALSNDEYVELKELYAKMDLVFHTVMDDRGNEQ
tara:strand:- start:274 stop:516 length:243 start_codon:yes stop_codon:yes gene_type:complete